MQMKKYVIVNAINNVPIRKVGFCAVYANKEEAKRNCDNWNKLARIYNMCTATVKEVIR